MAKVKPKPLTVDEIIQKAVAAQRIASERQAKDIFKATEKRLYAYSVIKKKIEDEREQIEDIRLYDAPGRSKSIVFYQRSGQRLSPKEKAEGMIADLEANIAWNERELQTIDRAIGIIADDQYADVVKYKYFNSYSDDEIATIMHCDPSTIRRHKGRLVSRIAVYLYGAAAVV